MAGSLMAHHAEVQYQSKSSSHYWAALWQGYNCSPDEWQHWRMVQATVRVKQGCLLSPTLFNIFLEWIMSDALEEHDGKVSMGGRNITNLRFADVVDALAEDEQELEALVESLNKTCTRYKMENSADDKQCQWHPERNKGRRAEVGYCSMLEAPWSNCFRWWLQTRDSLNDCANHCCSYKTEAPLER